MDFLDEYVRITPKSAELFLKSQKVLPGGNTRTAYFYRPHPIYAQSAKGSKVTDVDGNTRIDLVSNFGPLILGHNNPSVVNAVLKVIERGQEFGAPTEMEIELGEMMCRFVPCSEKVTFTATGNEACAAALRVARAFTGRRKIAKFEGHYHGVSDYAQISVSPSVKEAGEISSPRSVPDSEGISSVVADDVVVLPWNDLQGCESLVKAHADELGVIILDPSAEGSGVIPPRAGFLEGLKELTERYGIVLLFDEVLTGFRLALGGAQEKYGVTPDLAAFGKAMGGGSPIGAVAGRKDIMELFENKGVKPRVRNSGSFNGYPVSLASSIATLKELKPSVYDQIENNARRLQEQLTQRLAELKLKGCVTRAGGIMHLIHFGIDHLDSFRDAANTDKSMEYQFGLGIMCKGVYMPPFKPCLISAAITKQDIDSALSSMSRVLAELRPTSA